LRKELLVSRREALVALASFFGVKTAWYVEITPAKEAHKSISIEVSF
jgi:hypothetical protein